MLAYIDPGSSSLLLQLLVGFLAGAGIFYRRLIFSVGNLFRRDKDSPPSDSSEQFMSDDVPLEQ